MVGMKFGRWTVIGGSERHTKPCGQKEIMYLCQCECGKKSKVRKSQLLRGKSKSCGCLSADAARERAYKHGMSNSKIRSVHNAMKQRCDNPNNHAYIRYGGRGIIYSQDWVTLNGFLKDMLHSYKEGLSLERVDVNGNYCKENCKWISMDEQARNKRNSIKIEVGGKLLNMAQISKLTGINYNTLRNWYYTRGVDYIRKIVA